MGDTGDTVSPCVFERVLLLCQILVHESAWVTLLRRSFRFSCQRACERTARDGGMTGPGHVGQRNFLPDQTSANSTATPVITAVLTQPQNASPGPITSLPMTLGLRAISMVTIISGGASRPLTTAAQ